MNYNWLQLNRLLTDGVDSLFFPPTENGRLLIFHECTKFNCIRMAMWKELVPEAVYLAFKARRE